MLLFPIDDKQSRPGGQDQVRSVQRAVSAIAVVWRLEVDTEKRDSDQTMPPGRILSPQLAVIVAQERDRANNLSGIHLSALDGGLKKIYVAAKKRKGERKEGAASHCGGFSRFSLAHW